MKSIKLKVTYSITNKFQTNNLITARVNDNGEIFTGKGKDKIRINVGTSGEMFADCGARFVELKTKTLKCTGLDHHNPMKKSFKLGKRYQVESGRALGVVAGYIFDEDGCRWTLFREEVGFSIADGTTFEAKYL